MSFKVKNGKLVLLAGTLISLFTGLGIWQIDRAQQKQALLQMYATRSQQAPLKAQDLNQPNDWRFYAVMLHGHFDDQHTILLDNKTFHGQVGYEVYTPFKARHLSPSILVDRGWIPLGANRQQLPVIPTTHSVWIKGLLHMPPAYVALGAMQESPQLVWPLRVEFIHLTQLVPLIGSPLYPYVLHLSPQHPAAFAIEGHFVTFPPARHWGYAIQWFALALTLLILSIVFYLKGAREK